MSSPFQTLTDYLDVNQYNYTPYTEENRINFNVAGHHAYYRVQLRITHEGEYFQIALHYPFRIRDEKMRLSVSELVTRANYMMVLGKFEMDMSDGKIRLHVAQLIEGGFFTEETVERIYISSLFTMDRYFPAFMQHIHAGYTPEDAVFHAELDSHAEAVEEEPKPAPKPEEKAQPSAAASEAGSPPSTLDARIRPSPKKTRKKGGADQTTGQGELPI
jgi:hypothetical protein